MRLLSARHHRACAGQWCLSLPVPVRLGTAIRSVRLLFCLSGVGRVQREGKQLQQIRPGDTVIIPPDVRHWHGAAPDKLFSHLAMSELNDKGEGTAWFEHVSDDDYNASPAAVT
jgi:hypothetical protein